ncbi:hypothetical protein CRE_21503 [Caenorhabditis remanei]|uniref:Uncharacterized protein n=1 Tax=Caenorhabditis remanei TaxID=31234 RepID=E3N8X2_CAERE|nr:hypothetical protein CRE_21503 [Caenorhabditis remanei]
MINERGGESCMKFRLPTSGHYFYSDFRVSDKEFYFRLPSFPNVEFSKGTFRRNSWKNGLKGQKIGFSSTKNKFSTDFRELYDFSLGVFEYSRKILFRLPDKEIRFRLPDKEIHFRRPDKKIRFRLSDKEIRFRLPDKEIRFRRPDKEIRFRLPDKEIHFRRPDKKIRFRLPDKEIRFRLPDKKFSLPCNSGGY